MTRVAGTASTDQAPALRPVLMHVCRAGERFEVGDGPIDLTDVDTLVIGRGGPTRKVVDGRAEIMLDDPWLSSRHAQLSRVDEPGKRSRFSVEDLASTNGILVNGVATTHADLMPGDWLETGRTFWVYLEEASDGPLCEEPVELGAVTTFTSSYARDLLRLRAAAPGDELIVLTGPDGAGRGFLARTLHVVSRRTGRFVHVDCRARSARRLLVDVRGSPARASKWKDAHEGTLFFERIETMPLEVQEAFADRVRAPARPGERPRIVVSSRLSLVDGKERGVIAPALADALRGLEVRVPSLSARRADMGLLLDDFLARARGAPAIGREACRFLVRHAWPRELSALARVVEAAAVLAGELTQSGVRAGQVELWHLPLDVLGDEGLALAHAQRGVPEAAPFNDDDESTGVIANPVTTTGAEPDLPTEALPPSFDFSLPHEIDETDPGRGGSPRHPFDPSLPTLVPPPRASSSEPQALPVVDADAVIDALERAEGDVSAAARALGQPRPVVQRWIRRFSIDPTRYQPR